MSDEQLLLLQNLIKEFRSSYRKDFQQMINPLGKDDYSFINKFMENIKITSSFSDKKQFFFINEEILKKYGKDYLKYILSENAEFNKKLCFYFTSKRPNEKEKVIIGKIINSLYKGSFLVKNFLDRDLSRAEIFNFFNLSWIANGNINIGIYFLPNGNDIEKKIKKENSVADVIFCLNKKDLKYVKEDMTQEIEYYIKNNKKNFLCTKKSLYKEWLNIPVNKNKMDILFSNVEVESIFFHMRYRGCITNDNFLCLLKLKEYGE